MPETALQYIYKTTRQHVFSIKIFINVQKYRLFWGILRSNEPYDLRKILTWNSDRLDSQRF